LTRTLAYDSADRQVSVSDGTGTLGAYLHNALGQRVSKIVGAATTHFLYDLSGALIAEADGATGATAAEYIAFEGMLLAYVSTGGVNWVHVDHLGTPQMLTDDTGAVVWDASYRPFGEAAVSGSVAFNLRLPGQYFDAETGLAYNYFRTYDAGLGRYVQSDPIGLRGGWNTFAYVGGNPVLYSDPSGLDALCRAKAICVGAVLGADIGIQTGCAVGAGTGATFGTVVEPGGGTLAGSAGGCGIGGVIGGVSGAVVGGMAGDAAANLMCEEEDEDKCEKLYETDMETCDGIARIRGMEAGRRCGKSAMERYGACLAGKQIPPLDTWNN